ncbi:MAG TPA: tetratricopeptide repeat protein [Terrimicrobiaceae bacterium]|nr:tetratricopeptide repeat protein [Terrimicrobiaceae bacterium]
MSALRLFAEGETSPDLAQLPTGELEKQAAFMVGAQKFGEAIPLLGELINRLGESKDAQTQAKVEGFRYFLGLGYVLSENWEGAATTFENFLKNHPKSNRYRRVLELYGDTLSETKRYAEAAEQYQKLLQFKMTDLESFPIWEKLASCYMRDSKWGDAVPVLLTMLQKSRTEAQREQAVVWLAQAYIESDQGNKVIELLPDMLTKAPRARLSIDFNMALLNGGDKMFAAQQDVLALLFYNLVLPPTRLLEANKKLEAELERQRTQLIKSGQVEFVVDINRRIQDLRSERAALEETPDFSEDLLMRIAQAYFGSNRFYEAFWTYWKIYQDYPQGKLAEESCYGAFALAAQLEQDEKAKEAGLKYLGSFPDGNHWDDVSLQLGQIFVRDKEYKTAIDYYSQILKTKPDHVFKDQILYMLGFSQFQDSALEESRKTFQTLNRDFPESDKAGAALYWVGMTFLFQDNYKDALDGFGRFLEKSNDGKLYEDASFRKAVCLYGLEKYPEAAQNLERFLVEFPADALTPEAQTLLGDCYGATGELEKALEHYQQVEDSAVKQSQIDYAALQIGRIYEQLERFKEMEDWFGRYLEKYGIKGDYTQAIYRRGLAMQAQGRSKEALDNYWQAIEKYGNDPKAMGIDIIIDAYCEEFRALNGLSPVDLIRAAALTANQQNERTRALRFERSLAQMNAGGDLAPFTPADVEAGSPAVLLWIAQVASRSDPALAESAARATIDKFGPTQWTGEAFLRLGDLAFEKRNWKQAETAYNKALTNSPMNEIAARATMRQGDAQFAQAHYDEAIKRYEAVLQVKEWKGPAWPEALYMIGESLKNQGKEKEAYAYYQRIYVLYPHFKEYTAKAYLRCAEISEKLGLKDDAVRTLGEMLANQSLRATSEYVSAEKRLKELQ